MHANKSWTRHFLSQRSKVGRCYSFYSLNRLTLSRYFIPRLMIIDYCYHHWLVIISLTGALMRNGVKCLGAFTAATFRPSAAVHSPLIRETDVRRLYALITQLLTYMTLYCITHWSSSKCLLFENIQHNKNWLDSNWPHHHHSWWQQADGRQQQSSWSHFHHAFLSSFQLSSLFYALIC